MFLYIRHLSKINSRFFCVESVLFYASLSITIYFLLQLLNMDFLKQKWSYWFSTLDVNHDGMITRADVDQTLRDFPKVEGLTAEEGRLAAKTIEHWWNTYILKGRNKVTEEDFINDLEEQYTEDKEKFKKTIRTLADEIIDVVDTDKTKQISLDNFVKVFKVWGHDNEALLRKSFELYKPQHGMVSIEEYTNDWVLFVTNEDPSKPDVVLNTYKNGF